MSLRGRIVHSGKKATVLFSSILNKIFRSRANGRFGILMFHRIANVVPGIPEPTWNVTPKNFKKQLKRLLELGYEFWPLTKVIDSIRSNREIPDNVTVVTFDDGYGNLYTNAWPVLKELHIPATIFLATAYMDSEEPFKFDSWSTSHFKKASPDVWRPLKWSECIEMMNSELVQFGSHTHRHIDFRNNDKQFKEDICVSLDVLQKKLGCNSYTFAFPFGSKRLGFIPDSFIDILKQYPVNCALTTEIQLVDPKVTPFDWGRLEVVDFDTGDSISAKLNGWFNWVGACRTIFRMILPPKKLC